MKFILKLFLILPLIYSCSSEPEWKEIRVSNEVYPADSMLKSEYSFLTDTVQVWVNTAYRDYPYKKHNQHFILAHFSIIDTEIQKEFADDSTHLAYRFLQHVRSFGVAHLAAQKIYNDDLSILLYAEDDLNPLIATRDFPLLINVEIKDDPDWSAYSEILKKAEK